MDSYRRSCKNGRTSRREGGFSGTGKWPIPLRLRERGAKATRNGNHDLVHVRFSLRKGPMYKCPVAGS